MVRGLGARVWLKVEWFEVLGSRVSLKGEWFEVLGPGLYNTRPGLAWSGVVWPGGFDLRSNGSRFGPKGPI